MTHSFLGLRCKHWEGFYVFKHRGALCPFFVHLSWFDLSWQSRTPQNKMDRIEILWQQQNFSHSSLGWTFQPGFQAVKGNFECIASPDRDEGVNAQKNLLCLWYCLKSPTCFSINVKPFFITWYTGPQTCNIGVLLFSLAFFLLCNDDSSESSAYELLCCLTHNALPICNAILTDLQ